MDLIRLEITDWEPCVLTFVFQPNKFPSSEVQEFAEAWLKRDQNRSACGCKYRYADINSNVAEAALVVRTEWVCGKCVQAFADAVQMQFPSLKRVELGLNAEKKGHGRQTFVYVTAKNVEFEDGKRVPTAPFLISRQPVTIDEFEKFVRSTGYVTLAERKGEHDTFRSHCGLSGLKGMSRVGMPVQFVTYGDAQAFCDFSGYRLPSEEEWLAAAVLGQNEIELTPWEELQRRPIPLPPDALDIKNWEITSKKMANGSVVTRRGPLHFLKKGWREPPISTFNRRIINENDYDISITFRVVKVVS